MKTFVASVAVLAFTAAPAMADCTSMTTAMSKKPVQAELLAVATPEVLKLVDGKRVALV
jgi:hypothetical protein